MASRNAFPLCAAIAATTGAMVALGSPAFSKNPQITVTGQPDIAIRYVRFSDIDLASPAGEKQLKRRVNYTIDDLCNEATGYFRPTFRYESSVWADCTESAWDQARPQVARAVQRAREIALTGRSSIAATALTISVNP